jgi:hypothetical protein
MYPSDPAVAWNTSLNTSFVILSPPHDVAWYPQGPLPYGSEPGRREEGLIGAADLLRLIVVSLGGVVSEFIRYRIHADVRRLCRPRG